MHSSPLPPPLIFNYSCAYGCFAYLYACTPGACSAVGGHKRASDPPGTRLVNHQVGAGDQTFVLWKSRPCS